MTVLAHHRSRQQEPGEQSLRLAVLRAFITIMLVTAVVAAAVGAATYVVSHAFVSMLD